MLRGATFVCALAVATLGSAMFYHHHIQNKVEASAATVLDFQMRDIDGANVKLNKYKGNVLLVVNVASKCGYTPQYEALQATYAKYKEKGFTILGFPANNFGSQEPGSETEIKEFCTSKFHVTFPMFAKISVKGDDQDPLYKFLTAKETNPDFAGDIKWNFSKFLVDRSGKVVARFEPKVMPDSPDVTAAIEKYIAAK